MPTHASAFTFSSDTLARIDRAGNDPPSRWVSAPSGSTQSAGAYRSPELAFWTNGYDVGSADDQGEHGQTVVGESIESEVFPQLFSSVSWSPDGELIAFAGVEGEQTDEHDEPTDIYSVRPNGSNIEQITGVGDAGGPLWSPDGKRIVFTRVAYPDEGGTLKGRLWSINADGSGLTEIAEASAWETFTAGSFAPDGSRLAVTRTVFGRRTGKTSSEIQLMDADGADRTTLVEDASDPAISPDGEALAFTSDRDGNGRLCYGDRCFTAAELYLADADGSNPQRLTETKDLHEAHPSWLPDGTRLAFQQGEVFENAQRTWIIESNPDGSCSQAILKGEPADWYANPAWRPSKPGTGGGRLSC